MLALNWVILRKREMALTKSLSEPAGDDHVSVLLMRSIPISEELDE